MPPLIVIATVNVSSAILAEAVCSGALGRFANQLAARAADPGDLADIVAGALLSNPRDRQSVLEAVEVEPRLELAMQAAAAALARTASNASAPN